MFVFSNLICSNIFCIVNCHSIISGAVAIIFGCPVIIFGCPVIFCIVIYVIFSRIIEETRRWVLTSAAVVGIEVIVIIQTARALVAEVPITCIATCIGCVLVLSAEIDWNTTTSAAFESKEVIVIKKAT
jgi:hypothetical protein